MNFTASYRWRCERFNVNVPIFQPISLLKLAASSKASIASVAGDEAHHFLI
jgi:hypothetical protein